jgi:PAS domain S-box-containing protein
MTDSVIAQKNNERSINNIEKKRLEELYEYEILDTGKDADFDSLTKLAANILKAPAAQINFIDKERQWSKSNVGVEMENIPRSISFCSHTVQQDSHLIVPDTLNDERFREFPFVADDPNVRFYAGVPIKGSRGNNIGSMCVVDIAPRDLSEGELETLKVLAREVETRLNLLKRNRELIESNEKLQTTTRFLDNSADLMFLIDPKRFRIQSINPEVKKILGFDKNQIDGQPLSVLSPGNDFLNELNDWAGSSKKNIFQMELQLLNSLEEPVWFQMQISQKDEFWYATARNISDRKRIEEKHNETLKILKNAQRIANVGHWEWYPDLDVLIWSDELHAILGTTPGTFTPSMENFYAMVHPDDRPVVEDAFERIVGGGTLVPFEHRCRLSNGDVKYVMERGEITRDESGKTVRVSGILQDITAIKKSEIKLSESLKEKELMLSEIHHRVKNNIALISGILQLELQDEDNEVISSTLSSINTRIKSMALIHENLYQSHSFTSVPFGELLKELVNIVLSSRMKEEAPHIMVQSAGVDLNINQAIPLALAINHLLFNCFDDRATPIEIQLTEEGDNVQLEINREGKSSFVRFKADPENEPELSIMLFDNLLKQLNGTYDVIPNGMGNSLTITFQKNNKSGSSAGPFLERLKSA